LRERKKNEKRRSKEKIQRENKTSQREKIKMRVKTEEKTKSKSIYGTTTIMVLSFLQSNASAYIQKKIQ